MAIYVDMTKFHEEMQRLEAQPARIRRMVFRAFGEYMVRVTRERLPSTQSELARSIRMAADGEHMVVGSMKAWARITHYGGTIYASGSPRYQNPAPPLKSRKGNVSEVTGKPIKMLAIPLGSAKKGMRPRDYANTFVFTSKKGNVLIAQKTAMGSDIVSQKPVKGFQEPGTSKAKLLKGNGIRILFVLKESVKIPKHPYMFVSAADRREFQSIILAGLQGRL